MIESGLRGDGMHEPGSRGRRGAWGGTRGRGGRGGNRIPRGRNDVGKSLEVIQF